MKPGTIHFDVPYSIGGLKRVLVLHIKMAANAFILEIS